MDINKNKSRIVYTFNKQQLLIPAAMEHLTTFLIKAFKSFSIQCIAQTLNQSTWQATTTIAIQICKRRGVQRQSHTQNNRKGYNTTKGSLLFAHQCSESLRKQNIGEFRFLLIYLGNPTFTFITNSYFCNNLQRMTLPPQRTRATSPRFRFH